MRCSLDVRKRVVDDVREGGSQAEAARRFKGGVASVYRWTKPGGLEHKRPGPHPSHQLDWEALRRRVETHADLTQAEAAQHFGVSRHGMWNALHKRGWTRKKNDRLPRAQPAATKTIPAPSGAVRSARSAARPYRCVRLRAIRDSPLGVGAHGPARVRPDVGASKAAYLPARRPYRTGCCGTRPVRRHLRYGGVQLLAQNQAVPASHPQAPCHHGQRRFSPIIGHGPAH